LVAERRCDAAKCLQLGGLCCKTQLVTFATWGRLQTFAGFVLSSRWESFRINALALTPDVMVTPGKLLRLRRGVASCMR
jgi:hypothetical protein